MENAKLSGPPDFGAAAGKYDYMKSKTTEELLDELIEWSTGSTGGLRDRGRGMSQGYISPSAPPKPEPKSFPAASPGVPPSGGGGGKKHTLSAESLLCLAKLLAREKGAELAAAYGVTPEGEKIDLLRPARRRTALPPAAGVRGC